ncbi:hypothetical protein ACP275_10G111700 [Erythranthe tilingii]
MCYVGKARKIFMFIVIVLVVTGMKNIEDNEERRLHYNDQEHLGLDCHSAAATAKTKLLEAEANLEQFGLDYRSAGGGDKSSWS